MITSIDRSCLPGHQPRKFFESTRAGVMPIPPPEDGCVEVQRLCDKPVQVSAQQLRKVIQRKLVGCKRKNSAKGCDLTSRSIISLNSRIPNRTAVQRATLSCSWHISQRTPSNSVLTGWTKQIAHGITPATTSG